MNRKPPHTLADRLAALAAFVPVFEQVGFSFGEWVAKPGHLPWFSLSADASRLVAAAYEYSWVVPHLHWSDWAQTPDGRRLIEDIDAVAAAEAGDLERLLTTHIRADRFVEGHLQSVYDSRHLLAILRRAAALLRDLPA